MMCVKTAGLVQVPGAPLTFLMMGGGGSLSDFLGSEILAKSVFFWVYERHRYFFGLQKKEGFLWVAKNQELRDFLGYAKKYSDFLGRQILKL